MEAPVVTVVDPRSPGRFEAPPDPTPVRRSLRPVERVLATAVALLLVAGLSTSTRLRDERAQTEALSRLQLRASAVDATLSNDGGEVTLTLLVDAPRDVTLTDVEGDGWRPVRASTDVPDDGLPGLQLSRPLDCADPPSVPRRFRTTADDGTVMGQVGLDVVAVLPLVTRTLRSACGSLDADEALLLTGSTIQRGPRELTVLLRLANAGSEQLRVDAVRFPGFAVTGGETLPLVLQGAAPVQLRRTSATTLVFRTTTLRILLRDCGEARAALDASRGGTPVDLLEVDVDGRGGPGTVRLDVRGVLAYLEQAWQEACG